VVNCGGCGATYKVPYGRPLLLEAALLLIFGLFGYRHQFACRSVCAANGPCAVLHHGAAKRRDHQNLTPKFAPPTSPPGYRSGHRAGQLFYVNRLTRDKLVMANRKKLRLHATLITSFFVGGLLGAVGFKTIGYVTTVPASHPVACCCWSGVRFSTTPKMDGPEPS